MGKAGNKGFGGKSMEEITVVIPVNFTDAGRLFGLFEIRNAVEAVLICVPLAAMLMRILPFGLLWRIGIVSAVTVITGGVLRIGIGGIRLLEIFKQYNRF